MKTDERLSFRATEVRDIPSLYSVRASTRQNAISKQQLLEWGITPESIAKGLNANELCGMVCEANGSIVAALEELESRSFDLVLMDCHMPEMDGFEASLAIRAWANDDDLARREASCIPIVALTADASKRVAFP